MNSSECILEPMTACDESTTAADTSSSAMSAMGGDEELGNVKAAPENEASPRESCVMRWLTTLTVVGVMLGVGVGILCNKALGSDRSLLLVVGFPGQLFINALKCLVVPMIFCSMVTSTASMSGGGANRMARWAISFYLSTTVLAALTGLLLYNIFKFAFQIQDLQTGAATIATPAPVAKLNVLETLLKFGQALVPENFFEAVLETQLLGIITFAIFFGYMLAQSEHAQPVISFFSVCFDTMVAMVRAVIYFTPIGVGSLVAASVAKVNDFGAVFSSLGALIGVIMLGQIFHVFVTYAGLYFGFTRKNPYAFLAGLPQVWMTAFGTSSSAATLSTTCAACEKLGVSREAINFVLPIGCTVNMDGSALERPIVVMFIAYVSGQPLDFPSQLVTVLTSTLLSIGGSPIPSAGLTTLIAMLETVGVELTATVMLMVSFILAIEWFLDGIRTTVNVTGDSIGVAIIDHKVFGLVKDEGKDCFDSCVEGNDEEEEEEHV